MPRRLAVSGHVRIMVATAAAAEAAVAAAVRGSGTAVGNRDKKAAVSAVMNFFIFYDAKCK